MLYDEYEAERYNNVMDSEHQLRSYLGEQITQCRSAKLQGLVRDMQKAVRRFLTRAENDGQYWDSLKKLRTDIANAAEALADNFKTPVDGDLSRIIDNGESAKAARATSHVNTSPQTPTIFRCPSCRGGNRV